MAGFCQTGLLILSLMLVAHMASAAVREICTTGRLYFGNVNENYPYRLRFNGVYLMQETTHLGRPVYQHESLSEFLYYFDGAMGDGYWVMGPQVGGTHGDFSIRASTTEPETAEGHWRVRTDDEWQTEERLSLQCVDESFFICKTGKLELTGLSERFTLKQYLTGTYTLLNEIRQLRPVYKHESQELYLYYNNGLWLIGSSATEPAQHSIFVHDPAFRPELITQDWVIFNAGHFSTDPGVQTRCKPASLEEADGASEFDNNIILPNQGASETVFNVCHLNPCDNNSTCVAQSDDTFFCFCDQNTFGPRCEREVICPEPEVPHGHVVSMTSQSFLGLASYECDEGLLASSLAMVCGVDAIWHGDSDCFPQPEVLYGIGDKPDFGDFEP